MGKRVKQIIYYCDICNKEGKDGEVLYRIGVEIRCNDCCNKFINTPKKSDIDEKMHSWNNK